MLTALLTATETAATSTASPNMFESVTSPIVELLMQIFGAAIPIVGAVGMIFCIFLGLKLAKAEEPQDREKAKQALKNAIIGFILIFVLVVAIRLGLPIMENWATSAIQG